MVKAQVASLVGSESVVFFSSTDTSLHNSISTTLAKVVETYPMNISYEPLAG